MKTGDKVKVDDGSYNFVIVGNELKHSSLLGIGEKDIYTIIAIDCVLPVYHGHLSKGHNNTIIKASDGAITFIQERFLVSIDKYCPTCGVKLKKECC